ncbi:MAG: L-rhamnose isomerase [Oscillospiraceae bacterium]|jgi:L-rhamnose isomerase|nr:L-rhamnose isomerase [Oscillospiraceae bacterium]
MSQSATRWTAAEAFEWAGAEYAAQGVDVESAMDRLGKTPLSLHCWQGDDVLGFESADAKLTGGIQATGNYPGRARSIQELRDDIDKAVSLIPGPSKVNLHTHYLDASGSVSRDALEPKHFESWADWANERGYGLDFNTTFFSHPLSESGSLSHADAGIRAFWIEHGKRCRAIAAYLGKRTGQRCLLNHWAHDGAKEIPIDTLGPRERLAASLDEIIKEPLDPKLMRDSVESKLFGIGSEAYVPGSHEFYMGYALTRKIMLTLDAGHFHPTEAISAKLTALLCFMPELLLHVSRPVRWDSDHVVLLDDETRQIMLEVVRADALDRIALAMDYFDASINRVAAWVIGARNTRKALLAALLEPVSTLKAMEAEGDGAGVLAARQEALTMPFGIVWDRFCETRGAPPDRAWIEDARRYEREVLSKR